MNPVTFNALSEQNRFHIVELLRDKPRSVNELVNILPIHQPQVSKHLKILSDAGIVKAHPLKNQRIYKLSPKRFLEIEKWLEQYKKLWNDRFDQLQNLLEVLQKEKKYQSNK